jgi:hypothetical protein
MFTISKQVIDWNGELYSIKRVIKETSIKEVFVQEYKEYINADTVLKRNGMYYFVEKIPEAQIVEEEELKLDETTEN